MVVQRCISFSTVSLHLVIAEYQPLERVYISDMLELIPILFNHMGDDGFNIFSLYEFEQFQTGGVEKVIARHGLINNIENQPKYVVMGHLSQVESILEANQSAEELQGS